MTPELTEERIAEAMVQAEKVACGSGSRRCFALPDPLEEARKTCTLKGRCQVGWIIAEGGRTSYDVWLDLHTGEGQLVASEGLRRHATCRMAQAQTCRAIGPNGPTGGASDLADAV